MTKRLMLRGLLPFLFFIGIVIFLWRGLIADPHHLSSPLINHEVPSFSAYDVVYPYTELNQHMFEGKVNLLNVFATWCDNCKADHKVIQQIARTDPQLRLFGLSYKDQRLKVLDWLQQYGNPFQAIINDANGKLAINLGVYGTPETFIIDQYGVIRYKFTGPLTLKVWQHKILPVVKRLENNA